MKNVLLLGDSIRMGYDNSVKMMLGDEFNVCFPEENCRFASYLLRYLHEYAEVFQGEHIDVIHWNAGLWDSLRLFQEEPHTPIEFYAYYIERICIRIQKLFPDAKVIFATSTSVQSERMDANFKRYNEDVEAYNNVAVEIVKKYGFQVNDLYATSVKLPPEAHSDAVHFYTSMGTKVFAEQVVAHILAALGIEKDLEYKEVLYVEKPIGI